MLHGPCYMVHVPKNFHTENKFFFNENKVLQVELW